MSPQGQPVPGIAALEADVRAVADVEAFGLVRCDGDALELFTRHRVGTTGHRMLPQMVPPLLRPGGSTRIDQALLASLDDAEHVFVGRLRQYAVGRVLAIRLGQDGSVFWVGVAGDGTFTPSAISALEAVAARAVAGDSADDSSKLARLRRLGQVDRMLPVLGGVLDVRDVFPRLAEIARLALPHEVATIQILDEERVTARLYALDGVGSAANLPDAFSTNYPVVFTERFIYAIHDDVLASAIERERPSAKAGMRSALRVPLRFEDQIIGALELATSTTGAFSETDVPVARRIADYVTVAIAHQRMADATRRMAAIGERTRVMRQLEDLLPAIGAALDIREVLDRVFEIAREVMPHDAMSIGRLSDDGTRAGVYATSGLLPRRSEFSVPPPDPSVLERAREPQLIEEMETHPLFAGGPAVAAGMKSVVMIPIWIDRRLQAVVNFFSARNGRFAPDDILIGRRIADHIALALSHYGLAEQARRNEELRARAARLELLDQLLVTLTDSGELPTVFDRISAIAQRVLAHDALTLPVLMPDGQHAQVYAISGVEQGAMPEIVRIPPAFMGNEDWEYDLVDDLSTQPGQRDLMAARLGYKSALRVPIRLEGRFAAALAFLSFKTAAYTQADVLVARRIADRLAVALERERRAAASQRADEATARASQLEIRVRELTDELDARTGYRRVTGESVALRQVLTQATQVAATETTVLLLGESGTGKEVVARFIHRASPRQDGPFVALNCAALPEQLLEAELFGYERGAFTGATQSKPGQLEQAAGGTLFLDEVGEMSPAVQAKFLRVLQEREFQRLGGTRVLRTDARMIAATNRDLTRAIAQGTFREDLFYRLNVFAIALPPLRARREDVLPLAEAFLAEFGRSLGRPPSGVSRDARKLLMEYDWPGNVRELRNILERAAILCDGGLITAEHLNLRTVPTAAPAVAAASAAPAATAAAPPAETELPPAGLAGIERTMVAQALEKHRFNKSKAAKELGLTRAQLYVRRKRYGLD
jgi:transcriptional regulator with GAF, ATPase, and Fis domain